MEIQFTFNQFEELDEGSASVKRDAEERKENERKRYGLIVCLQLWRRSISRLVNCCANLGAANFEDPRERNSARGTNVLTRRQRRRSLRHRRDSFKILSRLTCIFQLPFRFYELSPARYFPFFFTLVRDAYARWVSGFPSGRRKAGDRSRTHVHPEVPKLVCPLGGSFSSEQNLFLSISSSNT